MLQLLVILGFGLVAAAVFKAFDNRRSHAEKLERVRREIERREQAALRAPTDTDTNSQTPKDPS